MLALIVFTVLFFTGVGMLGADHVKHGGTYTDEVQTPGGAIITIIILVTITYFIVSATGLVFVAWVLIFQTILSTVMTTYRASLGVGPRRTVAGSVIGSIIGLAVLSGLWYSLVM